MTAEQRRDLLEIMEDRHGRSSTMVPSQLPVEHWHEIIGDPTLADAIRRASHQRACACGQASKLSAGRVLKYLLVDAQIGHNLPQLAVLVFELLQLSHLDRQQPVILLLPIEEVAWLMPALRQISATGMPSA
jgi:hypothetical protein